MIQTHQEIYRGYAIEMKRSDLCWKVTLKPSRSELPIPPHSSFRTITQSKREAIKLAQSRVDNTLAQRSLVVPSDGRDLNQECATRA
jgi:hypothetical protein